MFGKLKEEVDFFVYLWTRQPKIRLQHQVVVWECTTSPNVGNCTLLFLYYPWSRRRYRHS